MNTFTEIYKDRDLYVPAFDLKINGQSLPGNAAKDVIDVRYNDSIDAIDNFEITVNNWDADEQDFKYTGSTRTPPKTGESNRRFDSSRQTTLSPGERSHLFDPGQEIELWMGYFKPPISNTVGQETGLRLMLAGLITKITPNFPASGQPTLKVVGQNALRKFMTVQATHVYEDIKDSDIAEQVGKRGKFKIGNLMIPVRTDKKAKGEEPKNDHVLQDNQYDIVATICCCARKPSKARQNNFYFLDQRQKDKGSLISWSGGNH
jgi:uncharacterized protein